MRDRAGIPTARRLKAERALRGWNQAELADHAGLARVTVANVETDAFRPSPSTRTRLARALGLDVSDLFASEAGR